MRLLPLAMLLLLGACASHGGSGLHDGQPGVDVAEAALRGGSPQVAMQIDSVILAKDPHNVPALINRGDVQTAQQLYDEAATSYAAALQADPDSLPARIGLGRVRLTSDPAAAERLFQDVVQRDSHNAIALNDLGIARDLLGRHRDAQLAYRQAMGIDPTMVGVRVNLALSLAMTGRADDAAPMLRPMADSPSAPRKYRHDMAVVLAMGGDREGAERILSRDMSPEQANKAVSIFMAASAPTGQSLAPDMSSPAQHSQTSRPSDSFMVQLASGVSSAVLEADWNVLRTRLPQLLGDRQPTITQAERNGHVIWRLQTGTFGNASEAAAFCGELKSMGGDCFVTRS
jgi:Flp pilus assembly protein TadD